jgi:RHS repeat-associated protein
MSKRLTPLIATVALFTSSASTFGLARMFMVPAGEDPTSYPSGQTTVEVDQVDVQSGGLTVTLDIYLENTTPTLVRGYQIAFDDASGGTGGSVNYDSDPAPPAIDELRGDYVFAAALSQTATAVDIGAPARLAAGVADAVTDSVPVTTPVYLGELTYDFSTDATGTFRIDFIDPGTVQGASQTIVADDSSTPVAFIADGVVINIVGGAIPTVSEWSMVVLALLILTAGTLVYTRRRPVLRFPCMLLCVGLTGVFAGVVYADTGGPGSGCPQFGDANADGVIDLFDIFCFLDGTEGVYGTCTLADVDLAPCGGDGSADAADVAVVEDAFAGDFACAVDCLEPGFEPGTWSPPLASLGERARAGDSNPMANVYGFSGEFHLKDVDLRIKGRGIDFVWARKYRSRLGSDTAQGNGWDFSYNIYIKEDGPDRIVSDGNSRRDRYELQPDGTWTRDEFFRVLEENPDGTYTVTFRDNGRWEFHALDGSPQEGKLDVIDTRNGNSLSFEYDGSGRLVTIRDALDAPTNSRVITIAYNAIGFVESVTDFTARSVTYAYYDGIEPGGNAGDLKSVTSPAVTGTPNGNDFPNGKTTVYTYSTGFADDRLNHNLLTITDPKGQTFLTNEYAPKTDPQNLRFDRVERQIWGNPSDVLDSVYTTVIPQPSNHFAVSKATVNDRVGNVSQHFYDKFNRYVVRRDYTGRANPSAPTNLDLSMNSPITPLRPSDPAFFEFSFHYNEDSLVTHAVDGNGNDTFRVYELALNPAGPRRSAGNLRELHQLPGQLGGDQSQIDETIVYDPTFNFVTSYTDGRNNTWTYLYEAAGNRTHMAYPDASVVEDWEYNAFGQVTRHLLPENGAAGGQRRDDAFTYYGTGDGAQNGYLEDSIVDAPGLALTTTYDYDAIGRVTRATDPRGNDSLFTYNALDQVVKSESPQVGPLGGARYDRLHYYDENDNWVRRDVRRIDDGGNVDPLNEYVTTIYEFDVLNRPTQICRESGSHNVPLAIPQLDCIGLPDSEFIHEEFEYDANSNLTLTQMGEAAESRQLTNTLTSLYDERDLLFQSIRAATDSDQSSTQFDYDANGNIKALRDGLESAPRMTSYTWDGYDRLTVLTDAMDNETSYQYDASGNLINSRVDGELLDLPGAAGNTRLAEVQYVYDAVHRLTLESWEFFDRQAQGPIGDGQSTTQYFYSPSFHLIRVVDDNNHDATVSLDTANRVSVVTDAKGNTLTYSYDANSNVTAITELDKSDLGNPDETFVSGYTYDSINRLTGITDSVGNVTTIGYDSRDNLTVETDALNHEARYTYDGINRLTLTVHDMNALGADPADPIDIVLGREWDDSTRLVTRTDDNGNVTTYTYDPLNRLTRTTYFDTTTTDATYDVHDNQVTLTDANGSVTASTYDLLNRRTGNVISPGAGIGGTTFENFSYDGLSDPVVAEDDDSMVTHAYDSLGQVTRETMTTDTPGSPTTGTTDYAYDGVGNRLSLTYPGGRVLTTTYDELDRISEITEPGSGFIANYSFIGPRRMERMQYGNNTQSSYVYDGILPNPPGDFGVQQMIGTTHMQIGGGVIDQREYSWDRRQNKVRREDLRAGSPELLYEYVYDDLYRLTRTVVRDSVGSILRDTQYLLDGAGNRDRVLGGDCPPGTYSCDSTLPEPADCQMNQYTDTECDSRQHDRDGNMTGIPAAKTILYDYADRMIEHQDLPTGVTTTYSYDAFGRRIAKVVSGVAGSTETRYFYDDWQVIEEQNAVGATEATYAYGGYIDDPLQMRRAGDFYYHADDLGNVMAVTDAAGNAIERYEYGDYGRPQFFSGAGAPLVQSLVGNPYAFSGRRYDQESGLYYFRTRYLDPAAGRFLSRDPIGIWGDRENLGNASAYVGNNPWTNTDPLGLMNKAELIDDVSSSVESKADAKRALEALNDGGREIRTITSKITKGVTSGGGGLRSDGELVQAVSAVSGFGGGGSGVRSKKLFVGGLSWDTDDGSSASSSDKRKQSLYFPETMFDSPWVGADATPRHANGRKTVRAHDFMIMMANTESVGFGDLLDDRRWRFLRADRRDPGGVIAADNPTALSASSIRRVRGGMSLDGSGGGAAYRKKAGKRKAREIVVVGSSAGSSPGYHMQSLRAGGNDPQPLGKSKKKAH